MQNICYTEQNLLHKKATIWGGPENTGYLIRLIIMTKLSKGNQDLKGLMLPLCLSGILLGEMTFDNTKNNLRTSCLHLLECHTACYWAFPPLTAVNASSSKKYWCTIWGCWYWKWLRWWVYTEQSLWHQEIIFLKSFSL